MKIILYFSNYLKIFPLRYENNVLKWKIVKLFGLGKSHYLTNLFDTNYNVNIIIMRLGVLFDRFQARFSGLLWLSNYDFRNSNTNHK